MEEELDENRARGFRDVVEGRTGNVVTPKPVTCEEKGSPMQVVTAGVCDTSPAHLPKKTPVPHHAKSKEATVRHFNHETQKPTRDPHPTTHTHTGTKKNLAQQHKNQTSNTQATHLGATGVSILHRKPTNIQERPTIGPATPLLFGKCRAIHMGRDAYRTA